jgi:response regulator of citrate/malate metabolism
MVDVTKVEVNEDAKEVLISGVDLDSIWCFKDEPDETAECNEVAYKFDISLAGARKYLYLVTKNNKKANEFTYMNHRLEALVGQTIQLSDNFRVKDEA